MADASALAGLLDRAANVFRLASNLGWEFGEEMKMRGPVHMVGDEPMGDRYREKINDFISAVLDLRDAVKNPPDGFAAVADQLRKAGQLAKRMSSTNDADVFGLFPDLNSVAYEGYQTVKSARTTARLDDPFKFLDEAPNPTTVEPAADAKAGGNLIERLLAGPNDAELTRSELALLDAHLKQARTLAEYDRDAHDKVALDKRRKLTLIRDFNRNLQTILAPSDSEIDKPATNSIHTATTDEARDNSKPKKVKRSTERGEGRAKLISALTKHHQYADGGCLNLEPIGNNELARLAQVDQATASAFFKQQFKGHSKYKATCSNTSQLTAALKLLNGEFAPHLLYGAKPPNEDERGDE